MNHSGSFLSAWCTLSICFLSRYDVPFKSVYASCMLYVCFKSVWCPLLYAFCCPLQTSVWGPPSNNYGGIYSCLRRLITAYNNIYNAQNSSLGPETKPWEPHTYNLPLEIRLTWELHLLLGTFLLWLWNSASRTLDIYDREILASIRIYTLCFQETILIPRLLDP